MKASAYAFDESDEEEGEHSSPASLVSEEYGNNEEEDDDMPVKPYTGLLPRRGMSLVAIYSFV